MEKRSWELTGSWLGLPGRRLWVERAGQGPAVVLAHAAIGDRRMWTARWLAALAAAGITGARLAVLAEVDHNVPVRAGRGFTDLVAGFLDQLNHSHWRNVS